jgi:protein involved in polysaccharide export with SLBB domain
MRVLNLFAVGWLALAAPAALAQDRDARALADTSPAEAARAAASVAIAVGDRIALKVWREPWLSDSAIIVDERGDVLLPRVGSVRVAGRSIASVQDSVAARLGEFLRNPSVKVTVFRRVSVQGEVRAPNLYYVDVTTSLRELLALAGGVTENGSADAITIVREGRRLPQGAWRDGAAMATVLQSGDQIVVGRRSWLSRNALAAVSTAGLVLSVLLPVLRNK